MKHAWSFFWLMVASAIAITIISQMVAPYIPTIITVLIVIVVVIVGWKVYRYFKRGRRDF